VEHNNVPVRSRAPTKDAIGTDVFHRFFDDKVKAVSASTVGAASMAFSTTEELQSAFQAVSTGDVIIAIRQLYDKCCASAPVPTDLLMAVSYYVGAISAESFN
jgi:hypothetical protein